MGSNALTTSSSAYVGINNKTPSFPLDVTGTMRVVGSQLNSKQGIINLGNNGTFDANRTGFIQHDGTNMLLCNNEAGNFNIVNNQGSFPSSIISIDGTTGLTTISNGLSIAGSNNIKLGNGSIAPTQGIQLGGMYKPTITWSTSGGGTIGSQTIEAGTYISTITINLSGTYGGGNYIYPLVTGIFIDYRFLINPNTAFGVGVVSGTYSFKTTTSTTASLVVLSTNSFSLYNSGTGTEWNIIRIG